MPMRNMGRRLVKLASRVKPACRRARLPPGPWGPTYLIIQEAPLSSPTLSDGVRDNPALGRFELEFAGETAVLYYQLAPGLITLVHTEVPPALGGQGVASALAKGALAAIRARGLKVKALCPFISAFLGKHPEYNDLVK